MRVPLRVDWLSESGLLTKAAALAGYTIVPDSATHKGIDVLTQDGRHSTFWWESDELLFDLSQLAELGFEIGSVKAMEKAIADKEMGETFDINRALAEEYANCDCPRCKPTT